MRIPSKDYRLRYGPRGFAGLAERDGLKGSNRHTLEALATAGMNSLGTLPRWPVGGIEPGETSHGPAGRGVLS